MCRRVGAHIERKVIRTVFLRQSGVGTVHAEIIFAAAVPLGGVAVLQACKALGAAIAFFILKEIEITGTVAVVRRFPCCKITIGKIAVFQQPVVGERCDLF